MEYVLATYIGRDSFSFKQGKQYFVVGYCPDGEYISVVDESRENYLYVTDLFQFTTDYHHLPEKFPDVYLNEKNELEEIVYEKVPMDDIVLEKDYYINMTGEDDEYD